MSLIFFILIHVFIYGWQILTVIRCNEIVFNCCSGGAGARGTRGQMTGRGASRGTARGRGASSTPSMLPQATQSYSSEGYDYVRCTDYFYLGVVCRVQMQGHPGVGKGCVVYTVSGVQLL